MCYNYFMKNKMTQKGFTLIEILVVVLIIGILAILIIGGLQNDRQTARDQQRLSDMRDAQSALTSYYLDTGSYPSASLLIAGQPWIFNGKTYLSKWPSDPQLGDGSCSNAGYVYNQDSGGMSYHITYCLAQGTDNITPGNCTLTPQGGICGR